jgi:hypothetical protein
MSRLVTNAYPTYLAQNPLRKLPRGYATYNRTEAAQLHAEGLDCKEDQERDRRISTDEESAIVGILTRRAAAETDPASSVH